MLSAFALTVLLPRAELENPPARRGCSQPGAGTSAPQNRDTLPQGHRDPRPAARLPARAGSHHTPRQRAEPQLLQNPLCIGGHEPSAVGEGGGWLSEDLGPPHRAKVAQQLLVHSIPFLSFFFFFNMFSSFFFLFFFLTWPPK